MSGAVSTELRRNVAAASARARCENPSELISQSVFFFFFFPPAGAACLESSAPVSDGASSFPGFLEPHLHLVPVLPPSGSE